MQEEKDYVIAGLTHLLAAVESLTFLPSKEAKCCSRASRRLLGACRDRKHIVSRFLRCRIFSMYGNQDNRGQWWATKIGEETFKAIKKKIQAWGVHVLDLELFVCLKTLGYWLPTTDHSLHSSPNKATLGERNMCVGWPTAPRHFQQVWKLLNQPCLSTTGAAIIYSQWATPVHTSTTWPKLTEFTTASVFSFNCFSPRCRRTRVRAEACKETTLKQVTDIRRVKW